mgnify:CR=1 FL=1
MQKSYRKNIQRDLKSNLNRFLSLFGIVALGVMILTGLMSFAPSMRAAGQKYYTEQNVFDLRVLSTLGLSEEDISAIASTEGVSTIQPVKYLDAVGRWATSTDGAVLRVQQLPADPADESEDNMNRLTLLEGRMPEAADECVVQVLGHGDAIPLGTTLTLPDDTENIAHTEYTVVGRVQDPQYFSSSQETTTAGDGVLDAFVFVPEGELTADYYTVCYLKVADAAQYDNYSEEYQDAVDAVADRLTDISEGRCSIRRAQLIDDANARLDDAKQTYNEQKAEAERQFAEAEQKLDDAQKQLDDAKAQLDAGEAELTAQKAALPDTMQNGADTLVASEEQVLEFEDQLQQIELLVNLKQVADPLLTYAETALNNAQHALDEAEPEDEEYTELRDALAKAQAAYDNINGQLNGYQAQLDAGKQQMYAQGLISSPSLSNADLVTEAKAALRRMKVQLLQGQLQLTTGTASAYTQFDAARTKLDEGWEEYNSGKEQLEASRTEYETQKADAEQKLADGQQQITDAEEQIADIQSGEWYVLDRGSSMSLVTFEQYADRMDAIARVFPVFFFLVAALVASTTMTRMVDENRLQLGTLKALGYSGASIAGKYLFYGIAASVLGSIVGMAVGFIVFPSIIWYAYRTVMFTLPTFHLRFYPGMAAASVALSAAVIGLATFQACRACLKEKTAALLLPRAPAAGKRIFLEYLTPLWKRMSFSQKTAARNLFRYKKRFFMTVLGVAGCTALLLIGFGIQDSLLPMLNKQTTELTHCDLTITLSDEKALTTENGLGDLLASDTGISSWGRYYSKSVTLYNANGDKDTVSIVAAEDEQQMTQYFTFRTRKGHKEVPFDDSSVILTEKTAERLGLSIGDTFEVETADGSRKSLTLTGITENYVFTRLYLSQSQLKALNGGTLPEWNTVYGLTDCPTDTARDTLRTSILACNYVSSVSFIEDTTQMFDGLIGCLNYVVILVIICAAALAAVVLYNLISVNLGERKKELATIKVLGFYDKEIYRYIFREIDLLSFLGSLVGLLLGVPLHQFIIRTVEMDQMMFIRSIAPHSFVFSVALTMLFNFVVCRLMRRHVRSISMVESMKAPE